MDGRWAILFWFMSLFGEGYQAEGWNVQRADVAGMQTGSAGIVQFNRQNRGTELRFTSSFPKWKRFNPIVDFSVTDRGGAWLGIGLYQQFDLDIGNLPLYAGFTFAPGVYVQGGEVDLGYPLEFRSGVEIGVRFAESWQVSLSYDHRSNADIAPLNPGLETIQIRISKTFN